MKPGSRHLAGGTGASRPVLLERLAFGALVGTAATLALTKIPVTDVPWHLATARHALSHGGLLAGWPTANTFSWTYPGHPLHQQYPVFQALLYGVQRLAGFAGLSVLHMVAWTGSFLLWTVWARAWGSRHRRLLLLLLVLVGLHDRMLPRPDMLTIPLLLAELLLIDAFRARGRQMAPLVGLVAVQWLLVNTHQMFTLGIALQAGFLSHLVLVRWARGRGGIATRDADLPITRFAAAFMGSLAVCLLTPLGWRILAVPAVTLDSLRSHRGHVQEFAPLVEDPYALALVAIALGLGTLSLWRRRDSWPPFEAFLFLLGLALAGGAVRGVVFSILLGAGVYARGRAAREDGSVARSRKRAGGIGIDRTAAVALTLGACFFMLHARLLTPRDDLFVPEFGLGRAEGQWPSAAMELLEADPPPGRMLNLSWHTGNALVWGLHPHRRVFVDPRFEAYPRDFLLETIAAQDDPVTFRRLVDTWDPGWFVGDTWLPEVVARGKELVDGGDWRLVHVDPVFFVLVRETPAAATWLAGRPGGAPDPAGLSIESPNTLLLQLLRLAAFYDAFGPDRARALRSRIDALAARHPELGEALPEARGGAAVP